MCEPLSLPTFLSSLQKGERENLFSKALEQHFFSTNQCVYAPLLVSVFSFFALLHAFALLISLFLLFREWRFSREWNQRKSLFLSAVLEFLVNLLFDFAVLFPLFPLSLRIILGCLCFLPTIWTSIFLLKDWMVFMSGHELLQGKISLMAFHFASVFALAFNILFRITGSYLHVLFAENSPFWANASLVISQSLNILSLLVIPIVGIRLVKKALGILETSSSNDIPSLKELVKKLQEMIPYFFVNAAILSVVFLLLVSWLIFSKTLSSSGMGYSIFWISFARLFVFHAYSNFFSIVNSMAPLKQEEVAMKA